MVSFPNCKINLGLNVIRKRADGFHDLETVFYPIAIKDVLEIGASQDNSLPVDFTATGLPIAGDTANNLCLKAYQLLKKDFPSIPAVRIHLHKAIPMGAGLGGGSADGAFTLKMLNDKFELGLTTEQLISYSLQLGSDCPFFILNQPCFAEGRGERLQPITLDLPDHRFVVVHPGIHISTGEAFCQLSPKPPARPVREIISQPISTWRDELLNDFEGPVFRSHPELKAIKENLYAQGAVYASMTGSGSTVYGIFEKEADISGLQTLPYQVFLV